MHINMDLYFYICMPVIWAVNGGEPLAYVCFCWFNLGYFNQCTQISPTRPILFDSRRSPLNQSVEPIRPIGASC